MTTWMVRSENGSLIPTFTDDGICAIGWHQIGDPDQFPDSDSLNSAFYDAYPEESPGARAIWAGVIRRFRQDIQVGDPVVTYDPALNTFHIGEVQSSARFEPERGEWPNVRDVSWWGKVPRETLSAYTQRRLGSAVTLFKIDDAAAAEIVAYAKGETPPQPPLELQAHAIEEFPDLYAEFVDDYLDTDEGRCHLALYDENRRTGLANFERILEAREQGQDIVDLVLDTALPYADKGENLVKGRWVTLAPVYKGPARSKHEGAGWQQPDDWPRTTAAIVDFLVACRDEPENLETLCNRFAVDPLTKGFQTGTLTPMLHALRPEVYHLHNLKTRRTLRLLFGHKFAQSLAGYPEANMAMDIAVEALEETLRSADCPDQPLGDLFDMFCHWLVAVKDYDFDRRYWIVQPGHDGENWEECLRDGALRVGYAELGDLSTQSSDEVWQRCIEICKATGISRNRLYDRWRLRRPKAGDGVVAFRGESTVLGVGEVTEGYSFESGRSDPHVIGVNWLVAGEVEFPSKSRFKPVNAIDRAFFDRARQAISDGYRPAFTVEAFELLARLVESPTRDTYRPLKERLDAAVKEPLQQLFQTVLAQVKDQFVEELETEHNVLSRFPKNDYGQGGAWPFLWIAAYPKGGSRIVGPQFFIRVDADRLRFGLFVSPSDGENLKRLQERALDTKLRERFEQPRDLGVRVDIAENQASISIGNWLAEPTGVQAALAIELTAEEVLAMTAGSLADRIADVFDALFPAYLLATQDPIGEVMGEPPVNPPYSIADLAEETRLSETELQLWADAVERKRQAILYGPPGTGKTYVAHRLAKYLVADGQGIIQLVQFHPAYAYEDFIQGLRPVVRDDGSLGYQVLPGRFLEFCEKARGRDGISVLIVDEINRADLARVFGELMYLLEYRDQAIPLAGGSKPFKIPSNVRIIGTMNTADRSIALVDHALRRRFAFLALRPKYEVLDAFHEDSSFPVAELIEVLQRINAAIGDANYHLGISYFLVPDLDRDTLRTIWLQEIEPYLEELFFDQSTKVENARWRAVEQEIW